MRQSKKQFLTLLFAGFICSSGNAQKIWSIKACVDTAFKNNISLNKSQLSRDSSKIGLTQSKAARLPNLNMSDVPSFNSGYSLDPFTYQYTQQHLAVNTLSLNSSVTLFNGELLTNTIRQNKLVYEASMLDIEKVKNDITLNVMTAYMQVLMDHDAIDVAEQQVEATTTQVEVTQKFVEFGKEPELNLLQIQSQLASDKLTKVNADNQLELDKVTLQQLMLIPTSSDFDVERQELNDLFPEIPVSTEEIDRIAESFLPQIKSASLRTDAAAFSLKMVKSGWLPKLTMTGALKTGYSSLRSNITEYTSYQQTTVGYLDNNQAQPVIGEVPQTNINKQSLTFMEQTKDNFNQVWGFNLTVPIFNNLQVNSNVAIAKINLLNAKLNEKQTKNMLRQTIETAYTNQVSSGKKLVSTMEQMTLEKRIYDNMDKKYAVGAIDETRFLIEKNNYLKVSMSLIQAKYDYVLKTKVVNFYLGKPLL